MCLRYVWSVFKKNKIARYSKNYNAEINVTDDLMMPKNRRKLTDVRTILPVSVRHLQKNTSHGRLFHLRCICDLAITWLANIPPRFPNRGPAALSKARRRRHLYLPVLWCICYTNDKKIMHHYICLQINSSKMKIL